LAHRRTFRLTDFRVGCPIRSAAACGV